MANQPLVLASKSAIRAHLLRQAGLRVETIPADLDERVLEFQWQAEALEPKAIAERLSREKALAVSRLYPGRLVLGADQTLALGAERLTKAKDRHEAKRHLQTLRGKTHQLFAGFALAENGVALASEATGAFLTMRPLSDQAVDRYLDEAGDSVLASVGCYQLEGLGVRLFSTIEGDYFTILGLPLLRVLQALRHLLWLED